MDEGTGKYGETGKSEEVLGTDGRPLPSWTKFVLVYGTIESNSIFKLCKFLTDDSKLNLHTKIVIYIHEKGGVE